MLLTILQQEWAQIVLSAIALGIAGLISYLFRLLQIWISTKIKNERIRAAMDEVAEEVEASVMSVYQTYVKELKKSGSFTEASQSEALQKAIDKTIENLSKQTISVLDREAINLAKLLEDRIEAAIAENTSLGLMQSSEELNPTHRKTIKG